MAGCVEPWHCQDSTWGSLMSTIWSEKLLGCIMFICNSSMWVCISSRFLKYWANSICWAFKRLFSESKTIVFCIKTSYFSVLFRISTFKEATSLTKFAKSFCFFIRDRLADSRLDSILFLFFSSMIMPRAFASDPELICGRGFDIFFGRIRIKAASGFC